MPGKNIKDQIYALRAWKAGRKSGLPHLALPGWLKRSISEKPSGDLPHSACREKKH